MMSTLCVGAVHRFSCIMLTDDMPENEWTKNEMQLNSCAYCMLHTACIQYTANAFLIYLFWMGLQFIEMRRRRSRSDENFNNEKIKNASSVQSWHHRRIDHNCNNINNEINLKIYYSLFRNLILLLSYSVYSTFVNFECIEYAKKKKKFWNQCYRSFHMSFFSFQVFSLHFIFNKWW